MSAINEREISLIKDEDTLKRLWQEAEDFGRKKEIRAHMYKLREARLKDLYCNSDVKDIQISSNTKKSFNQSTHADSLADHSFASLKSKEIRDSESPTRDVTFRVTGTTNDNGWNISRVDERSIDGKKHRLVQSAHTSGTEELPRGKLDFEAKNEQEIVTYHDGDDKNFIKKQGTCSNSFVRQEAVDDESNFKSSSTKSSSSSKTVTQQKSSYGVDYEVPKAQLPINYNEVVNKTTKFYSTDTPEDLKKHPSYIEGRTKISQETKTLTDGTVVTTTKYETTGESEINSTATKKSRKENFSKFSASQDENHESHKLVDNSKNVKTEEVHPPSRYYVEKTHTIPENTDDIYQSMQSSKFHKQNYENVVQNLDTTASSDHKITNDYDVIISGNVSQDTRRTTSANISRTSQENKKINSQTSQRKQSSANDVNRRVSQQKTTIHEDIDCVPLGAPIEIEIDVTRLSNLNKKAANIQKTEEATIKSERKTTKSQDDTSYKMPEKRDQIKHDTEMRTKTTPTEGQYETTYRTDYTSKRISNEVSPTHDAFARSLRAVSPDRLTSRTNSKNLKSSNSSLRSSSSPEKSVGDRRHPNRISPERQSNGRSHTPSKKTPDRFSSTETITYKTSSRSGSQRSSPEKLSKPKKETFITTKNYSTDTVTRRKKVSDDAFDVAISTKSNRNSPPKYSSSMSVLNEKNNQHIITDLDDDISVISQTTVTKTEKPRKSTKPATDTVKQENISSSVTKKQRPADKPLKRTDTYEERCRLILGITAENNEKRRSSLEKLKRRGSSNLSSTDILSKTTTTQSNNSSSNPPSFPRKSPDSHSIPPTQKNPIRGTSPLREYPSQTRRPDNSQPEKTEYVEPSNLKLKKSPVREYPSQIRRSPENSKHQPSRKSSKDNEKINSIKGGQHSIETRIYTTETYLDEKDDINNGLTIFQSKPEDSRANDHRNPDQIQPKKREHIYEEISEIRKIQDNVEVTRETQKSLDRHVSPASDKPSSTTEFPSQQKRTSNRPNDKLRTPTSSPDKYVPEAITPEENQSDEVIVTHKRKPQEFIYDVPKNSMTMSSEQLTTIENSSLNSNDIFQKTNKNVISTLVFDDVINEFDSRKQTVEPELPLPKEQTQKEPTNQNIQISHLTNIRNSIHKTDENKSSERVPYSKKSEEIRAPHRPDSSEKSVILSDKIKNRECVMEISSSVSEKSEDKVRLKTSSSNKISSSESDFIGKTLDEKYIPCFENSPQSKNYHTSNEITDDVTHHGTCISKENIDDKKKTIKSTVIDTPQEKYKEKKGIAKIQTPSKERPLEIFKTSLPSNKKVPLEHDKTSKKELVRESRLSGTSSSSTTDIKKTSKKLPSLPYDSDVSSEDEEIFQKKHIAYETYEGRVPVEEPLAMKKCVSLLHSDEEDDKEKTQLLIEAEIRDQKPILPANKPKTEKTPKALTLKLISKDIQETALKKKNSSSRLVPQSKPKGSNKKPAIEKYQNKHGDRLNKGSQGNSTHNQNFNTLSDIENFDQAISDKSTHIRTHRIDDIIVEKKTTSPTVKADNEQKTIKPVGNKPSTPKPTSYDSPKKLTPRKPDSTSRSSLENVKFIPKSAKPIISQKTVKISRISSQPKLERKTPTNVSKTRSRSEVKKSASSEVTTKKLVKLEDSDEESIPDSLNEILADCVTRFKYNKTDNRIADHKKLESAVMPDRKTPTRTQSKPELTDKPKDKPTLEKRCLSTKSMIVSNSDTGMTVDLHRSISSREPTPDRVCPLPVSSDEDGLIPRYPDNIMEPDDSSMKRKHKKLFETIIDENGEGNILQKIIDITDDKYQKVTEVDKVDNDDESLLTVDKKINKFLTTAEKLTEKCIVDITHPAPKVERPKFDVEEALREDDCLLSVSDKVNKFISEAEHLTTTSTNHPRKSVILEVKSGVPEKINHFSKPQENKTDIDVSTNVPEAKNNISSSNMTEKSTNLKTDATKPKTTYQAKPNIEQDIFITTECSEIEKEEDIFRTAKRQSNSSLQLSDIRNQTNEKPDRSPSPKKQQHTNQRKSSEDESFKRFLPTGKDSEEIVTEMRGLKSSREVLEQNEYDTPRSNNTPKKEFTKDFTLKSRRPSQEEKVILSRVGRLRSSESIKKAKAIFDNGRVTDKDEKKAKDIVGRPSVLEANRTRSATGIDFVRRTIDRSNITPKRLEFVANGEVRSTSQTREVQRQRLPEKESSGIDSPGYMKPLDRPFRLHSPNREKTFAARSEEDLENTSVSQDDLPGYMKPLDRSIRPQSPQRSVTHQILDGYEKKLPRRSSKPEEDIPHYMKPLDGSHRHYVTEDETLHLPYINETHRSKNLTEGEIPGYMKPLEGPHEHHDSHLHLPELHKTNYSRDSTASDKEIPSYMKPLESSLRQYEKRRESNEFKKTHSSKTSSIHEGEIPGYMKPLERPHKHYETRRDSQPSPDYHDAHHIRSNVSLDGVPGYMKPLERPHKHDTTKERVHLQELHDNIYSKGPGHFNEIPHYMKPLDRSLKHEVQLEKIDKSEPLEDESEPEEELPGYMKPLDRSSRHQSPKRDGPNSRTIEPVVNTSKFGVNLKRTDSSKGITNTMSNTIVPKKHPIFSKKYITEEDIEKIYELDVLEELLLKASAYDLRRKIRSQIRIIKKLLSENKLEVTLESLRRKLTSANLPKETTEKVTKRAEDQNKHTRKTSPHTRRVDSETQLSTNVTTTDTKYIQESSEFSSTYTRKESVSSVTTSRSIKSRESKSPKRESPSRNSPDRKSPDRKSPPKFQTATPTRNSPTRFTSEKSYSSYEYTKQEKEKCESKPTKTILKSSQKVTEPNARPPIPQSQPEWITQRNLRKVNSSQSVNSKISTSSSSSMKKKTLRSSSPPKEVKSTDLITSSYGVGPTDENGTPLFGLKALRAQNKNGNSNSKVKGTVISSHYYSETGKEPVGQISVTKYSSDSKDLGSNENLSSQEGDILSITTTQKFGYDDAPSLRQLTNTKKEICDAQTDKRKKTSKSSTVTRRNSVKALTQKFVENAVEVSKNERQQPYPKAGLILRSSSFKNDSAEDDIEDFTEMAAEELPVESVCLTTNSRVVSGGSFLRNKSQAAGVEDAISRMRAEDIEDGDTAEDIKARGLLNKYLGSQVILSSIEGQVSKTTTATAESTSCSTSVKRSSKIVTTTTENGKEVTKTRIFDHPISEEVLETVWDVQTLRHLLDRSTEYDERKRIRARLRFMMAEQEESIETTEKIVTEEPLTTTKVTTRITSQHQQMSKKPLSPFAKFRQLDKQNSLNSPPSTPRTPGGSPLFKFTDAALSQSASTIKDRLLYWCRMKTKEYENIQLDNFSSSWADGLAFCALIHHFLPNAFDYHALTPKERRHNFTLAFKVADEKADIAPLLDVDDMVATRKPDWKCVFTYVQSIYRRFKDEP